MAKNFLEQILSLAGLKLPDAKGHYAPSVYRDEPKKEEGAGSGLSGVERYLQKKIASSMPATTELTGVEKYLAEKQKIAEAEAAVLAKKNEEAEMTRVEKYLAKKQQEDKDMAKVEAVVLADMTGVAKYLARLQTGRKTAQIKTEPAKKASAESLTGVDKYLAKHKESAPVVQQPKVIEQVAEESKPAPKAKAQEAKADVAVEASIQAKKVTAKAQGSETTGEEKSSAKEKPASKLIDLAENATQCQAATVKGTQCRRTTNLEVIHKTIHKQKYKFAVCSQHNNNQFTPFSELVEN